MSDETSKSQDPEARRRRRRRRRGPRAEGGPGEGERGQERTPERAAERPQERAAERPQEPAPQGAAAEQGDARRRRRRRRRPREEGEASEAGGAESREAADAERGGARGTRTRARRGRRRAARPTGSQTPGADLQAGDTDDQPDDQPDDPSHDRLDDDDHRADDDRHERGGYHAAGRDRDAFDGDTGDDELDEHAGAADHDDPGADRITAFLRGPGHRGEDAVAPALDAGYGDQDEPSGVWAIDDATRDAGSGDDDDTAPAPPVREPVHYEEPPADDPDPASWVLDQADEVPDERALDRPVHNVVGVKFSAAGRIYLYDAGDDSFARGEEVVVDTERGLRTGTVAVSSARRVHTRGELKAVLRRPNAGDRRTSERNDERCREALQAAREIVRTLQMPMKVFRAEYGQSGKKAIIYFTAEERIDFRDLVRDLSKQLRCRVEMRQTGVRDEAKQVGGIGSCGRELCCTTWLPEFVPVSIKMAKDQGLVLNPTKVSGQCGRLKCCLVYEQDTYAALRKGLPKLGKRVITTDGEEGRVVEVDVLRQRVRVTLGPGEFRVLTADEIRPMFPSQSQKAPRPGERPERPERPK